MIIYEVGIKNRAPKTISADKMEIGSRGELIFKNKIESDTYQLRGKDRYMTKFIISAQKWDYVEQK